MKNRTLYVVALIGFIIGCKNDEAPPVSNSTEGSFFQSTGAVSGNVRALSKGRLGYLFAETPDGILRSTDSGSTWQKSLFASTEGYVAAAADSCVYASSLTGVYYSSNNGSSWLYSESGLTDTAHGVMPGPLVVAPNGIVFVGTFSQGVYRSTNHGRSWSKTLLPDRDVRSLHVNSAGYLFAGCNHYQNVINRSSDGGNTWLEMQSLSNQIIYTLSSDSMGNLYAGGTNYLYWSKDNGLSWTPLSSTSSNVIAVASISRKYIFSAIAGGGVFKSSDGGAIWEEIKSGISSNARCLLIDDRNYLFVGTGSAGIFRSMKQIPK